ncbi:MAG: A24 family peptidase [Gammaproteobacteria bacterium]|nr:A24 family peptidase [Gammaproteobacteria bacterium]
MISELPQTVLLVIAGLFGITVGSFLNVVIARLPVMLDREWRENLAAFEADGAPDPTDAPTDSHPAEPKFNLMVPRSTCPTCGHMITALENIPVISYLCLRGRCSGCQSPISARYPVVELLTGLACVIVVWCFGPTWTALAGIALTFALVALSYIDFDHQILPDNITLPFLWIGLLINMYWAIFTDLQSAVLGAVAGYLILWCVYQAFKLVTGKEGMGYGDFKLLAMLGAWLGWSALPGIVFLSSIVGAVIGISLIAFRGHDRTIPIPFGPYLAIAGWLWMLSGDQMAAWYMNFLAPPELVQ